MGALPALVSVVQLGRPVTVCVNAEASSLMQAAYCATVAVQFDGSSLQPGLVNAPASPFRQALSWFVQFCCSTVCVGALLDAAYDRPRHLQPSARVMALPK